MTTSESIPWLIVKLQTPSYLIVHTWSMDEYSCDFTKPECKANFDLRETFWGYIPAKYSCLNSFWFPTGQEESCNPNTIIFPEGEHIVHFSIFETDKKENIQEKTIIIHNTRPKLILPLPQIEIQSGITGTPWKYECKNNICKINISALKNFTGSITQDIVWCRWDFGTWSTSENCNPGYLTFWEWVHTISLTLFEKLHPENMSISQLIFSSSSKEVQIASIWLAWWISSSPDVPDTRSIIVQSGLEETQTWWICKKEECKVNLKFQQRAHESCKWDFGGGRFKEADDTNCNPWNILYAGWKHRITLLVKNEKKDTLTAYFLDLENTFTPENRVNTSPVAKITLDGKLWKNKILQGRTLVCYDDTQCSVNFSWKESSDPDSNNLAYVWDFWNGQTSKKANPSAIIFPVWKYTIRLRVDDGFWGVSEDTFSVHIIKNGTLLPDEEDPNMYTSLRIKSFLPNPRGKDDGEWIQLENTSWNILNLKNISLTDRAWKKVFLIKENTYLLPKATKKFYKHTTHLNLNNDADSVILSYNTKQIDALSWDFPVKDGYVLTHENLQIQTQKVKVIAVIDGDTITIEFKDGKKEKLRLIGIDTPETKHPKKKVEDFGKEASKFVADMLVGKEVYLEIDSSNYRDKYDRLLGYIRLQQDGKTFNETLIEQGYARAYLYFPFAYSEVFRKLEIQAKREKIWLWADTELAKEMKLLEKEEKQLPPIELHPPQDISLLYDKFLSLYDFQFIPKKFRYTPEKYLSFEDIFTHEVIKKKLYTLSKKEKKPKIPFSLQVTLLKSGLKISGKTLSGSTLQIQIGNENVAIISDAEGKFHYLKDTWLQEGEIQVSVTILGNEQEVLATKTKNILLTSEYIKAVALKKQKHLAALEKKAKRGKKWKKHTKKPVKPLTYISKTPVIFQNMSTTQSLPHDMMILYIFLSVGCILGGWSILQYVQNHRNLTEEIDSI
jgi:endonuclease YncB( thermonuclease family)/PKD repeat protein